MRWVGEWGAALALLTRLPGGRLARGAWPEAAACVWAYPSVGLVVGAIGGAALLMLERAGVAALAASAVAVALTVVVTGGLHEDGLADSADGLGGRTVDDRLAIMRDSRIGAHGATALGLAALLRVGALGSLVGWRGAAALVAASAIGRGAMLVVMASATPARGEGLGAGVAGGGGVRIGVGLVSAVLLAACLEERWVAMTAIGLGAGWAVGVGARRWLGGYTGDVLGAASVLAECGALLAASVR